METEPTMNTSFVLTDSFEMLKALYDFQAVYPKTISFDEGEHFILYQTSAKQRNWWQVVSMKGAIGFVPSNYVMKIKVEPSFLLGFFESSIDSLKKSKENDLNGIISRLDLIERLEAKKTQIALSAKVLASENEAFDNEKHYMNVHVQSNGGLKHKSLTNVETKSIETPKVIETDALIQDNSCTTTTTTTTTTSSSSIMPQNTDLKLKSTTSCEGINSMTITTSNNSNSACYDNSITSDPSEATNTISDDATVVSIVGNQKISESISEECTSSNQNIPEELSSSATIPPMMVDDIQPEEQLQQQPSKKQSKDNAKIVVKNEISINVDSIAVYQIIDSIRQTTNLSHRMSCVALRVVLSELEAMYSTKIVHLLEPIAAHFTENEPVFSAPDEFVEHTHDSQRLKIIFDQLADCKNDSEQRTWILHEDEMYIKKFLTELIEILKNADKKICKFELSADQYQSITNLIQYYQMETRWQIRKLLLESFKALCYVDENCIDVLLTSVLPMELVQDMLSNTSNIERLSELAVMLTIIFSMGQKLPIHHAEHISTDFILFLIDIIENPPELDRQDILSDVIINLVLAINLQFDDFNENFVLTAMRQIQTGKTFTEKILILLNREEEPMNFFEHQRSVPNSVLKIFVDLFSTPETASLFYTNDNKVLIDILVRQLSDLSAGDPLRRWYLELCRRIVRNTEYSEHTHRKSDLMKIFTRIFCEESECSFKDQQLVREIINEFPLIFKA